MIRHAIAVMVSRFPLITETFILRELIELERQGQPVLLVPMLREHPRVVHEEARPWVDRALYTPWFSAAIGRANLRALGAHPIGYLTLLLRLILGSLRSPGFMGRTLAIFPKSVFLAEEMKARGIRHVHAHFATHPATMALIISRLSGITFSVTAHAHDIFVDRALLKMKLRAASFVRAISRFNRDFLARLYPSASSKIEVIHVGVRASAPASPRVHARRDAARSGRGRPHSSGSPLILCIAALKPYKGVAVLIDALAQLDAEFQAEIIGDGPLRDEIESAIRAKKLNDRVSLPGNLPQHEVAERIARATMIVLPSVVASDGQMEGIPVALMEAMSAEKPVVASRLSGIPELVDDGVTGFLVEPGDATAFASAISRVLKNSESAHEMGRRGAEKVRGDFDLATTVHQLIQKLDQFNEPAALTEEELRILRTLHSAPGTRHPDLAVRRIHERNDSRVVEAMLDGHEVVVKTQKSRKGESRPPAERARNEFAILQKMSSHGAPRPLELTGSTILMERATGAPLDGIIRQRRSDPKTLAPAFRAAGAWLRRFHAEFPSMTHGDFWPGNVFVTADDHIEVIDFEGCRPGDPEHDIDYFLKHARGYFRAGRGFALLRRAFLASYQDPAPGTRHPAPGTSEATR